MATKDSTSNVDLGISQLLAAIQNVTSNYVFVFRSDSYTSQRFGRIGAVLMTLLFMHPRSLGEFEWDLNSWNDADLLAWKASYLNSCNIISVAVSEPCPLFVSPIPRKCLRPFDQILKR